MRMIALVAAALLTTTVSIAPASARPGWNHGHGWHHGHGRRCTTTWRHHHRVRVCR